MSAFVSVEVIAGGKIDAFISEEFVEAFGDDGMAEHDLDLGSRFLPVDPSLAIQCLETMPTIANTQHFIRPKSV
jgi:hypothetical protein